MSFTPTIKRVLADHGLTQADAGELLGMSQQSFSDRLRGRTPWRLPELEALADILDVPLSDLFREPVAA